MKMIAVLISVVDHIVPVPEGYTPKYLCVNAGTTYAGNNEKTTS